MTTEEKMEGITKELEKGVSFFFNTEHYRNYLDVMSRFHTYSLNNQILIAMQNPDATYVAGFRSWQKNFGRMVKKGEKGIVIIAPCKRYYYREEEEAGTGRMVTVKKEYISFRPTYVFDISQTTGKELPQPVKLLEGKVPEFNRIMEAVAYSSPFPLNVMEMNGKANGICDYTSEIIKIKAGMSEQQTIKTAVHEVAHARAHTPGKDRRQAEIEAESIAYCVCGYMGIDTSDYSFGYVAAWAGDKDVTLLKGCLDTIRKEAGDIIEILDKYMDERSLELGDTSVPEIEARAEDALNESIAELGLNSKTVSSRYYGCYRNDDYIKAKVMVQYKGKDREDVLFNEVNKNPVKIKGVVLDINPINEEKSGDIGSYYRQVKTWEKEDMTDDSWPMVTVSHSSCEYIPVGQMNIYEAERNIAKAEERMEASKNTSVLWIKLTYTYGGEQKTVNDRIFLGEGRKSFVNTVNISIPEKLYLKRHIQLLETVSGAKERPISPGTVYQEQYEDMMLEWAEKQRLELNYNLEPEIARPPALRPELVKQHEEWEMIR